MDLSPEESRLIPEALANDKERDKWHRKLAARRIIRSALSNAEISWEELLVDPTRGEVAEQLYRTWTVAEKGEPLAEHQYFVTSFFEDVATAMAQQGIHRYFETCSHLGHRVSEAFVDYVLRCHGEDAEAVEEELLDARRLKIDEMDAAREEAAERRAEDLREERK